MYTAEPDEEKKVVFHVKHLGQDSTYAITGYVLESYEDESDTFYFFNYHTEHEPGRTITMAKAKYKLVGAEQTDDSAWKKKQKNKEIIKEIIPLPQSLSLVRQKEIDRRKKEEPYRDEIDRDFVAAILPSVIKLLNGEKVSYDLQHIYDLIDAKIRGDGRLKTAWQKQKNKLRLRNA